MHAIKPFEQFTFLLSTENDTSRFFYWVIKCIHSDISWRRCCLAEHDAAFNTTPLHTADRIVHNLHLSWMATLHWQQGQHQWLWHLVTALWFHSTQYHRNMTIYDYSCDRVWLWYDCIYFWLQHSYVSDQTMTTLGSNMVMYDFGMTMLWMGMTTCDWVMTRHDCGLILGLRDK